MRERLQTKVTPEEREEIMILVDELSKVCNERIPIILKKKRLENLKKFGISTIAVSLQFECDPDVAAELKSRLSEFDENLTYYG